MGTAAALETAGSLLAWVAIVAGLPVSFWLAWHRMQAALKVCDTAIAIAMMGCGLYAVGAFMERHWGTAAMNAAVAVFVMWDLWRRHRRRRDRAPRTYGAKSRARVAALARKAREAFRPRPVLRPVPGGAR